MGPADDGVRGSQGHTRHLVARLHRVPGLRALANPRFQLIVALILLGTAAVIHLQVVLFASGASFDLHDIVGSARSMLAGQSPYQPMGVAPAGLSTFGPSHSNYPPTAYVLLTALAVASGPALDVAWLVLGELLVAGTVAMVYIGIGRPSLLEGVVVATLTLFFYPLLNDLFWGQFNQVTLFLVVAAVLAHQRARPILGGVALGLAVGLKLTPAALLLYFAWKRNWKLVAATLVTVAVMVGVTFLVGWGPRWAEYLSLVGPSSRGTAMYGNQTINGVLLRFWQPELNGFPIGALDPGVIVAWYAADALVLGLLLLSLRGAPAAGPLRTWTEVSLVLLALPLVQPVAWFHHHLFAVVAMVVGLRLVRARALPAAAVAALLLAYLMTTPAAVVLAVNAIPKATPYSITGVLASVLVVGPLIAIAALGRTRPPSAPARAPSPG
ncbi:MAG: glycosyltransferase family 87 protein [Candidatus Dormiibacterota bacterium]